MSIETMQLALEALEDHSGNYKLSKTECVRHNAAVKALRQAIDQAEKQEPVGYVDTYDLNREGHDFWVSRQEGKHTVPLYKAPPKREWVGLTADEIQSFVDNYLDVGDEWIDDHYVCGDVEFARAIEAKLKEKNISELKNESK